MNPSAKDRALQEFVNARRVGVLGAGVSGRAAARLLIHLGRSVTLFDDKDASGNEEVAALSSAGMKTRWGRSADPDAQDAVAELDALILSPGIPHSHPLRVAADARALLQFGELELGWMNSGRARIAAITGTNGKTTVTMLVRHILAEAGRHAVECGNIGLAISDAVLQHASNLDSTFLSTEVSSFQLETTRHFAPDVAMILNITPDHLDRHRDMENYAAQKRLITVRQTPEQVLVVNQDDKECLRAAAETRARVLRFALERSVDEGAWLDDDRLVLASPGAKPARLIDLDELPLFGMHNVSNALAAACAASAVGVGRKVIAQALKSFKGGPHRLELVATLGGVSFVNDSKATNIDAMMKAIDSFSSPIHLIAGGKDKESPFDTVASRLTGRVAAAYLIGEAESKIARAWKDAVEIRSCGTLARALEDASDRAVPGEVVLLAPGCASFDQFDDYAHRGETFREWVLQRKNSLPEPAISSPSHEGHAP